MSNGRGVTFIAADGDLRIFWLLPRKYDGHSGEPTPCSLFVRKIADGVPTLIRAHLATPAPSELFSYGNRSRPSLRNFRCVSVVCRRKGEAMARSENRESTRKNQGRTSPTIESSHRSGDNAWHRVHGSRRPPRFARGLLTHEGWNLFLSAIPVDEPCIPPPRSDAPVLQNVVEGAAVARTGAAALM
jgi:hypothetical protein